MKIFQSYLIIGSSESNRQQSNKIAKSVDIDLSKSSPDIFFISPINTQISIEQIRNLKSHIFEKPFKEKYKIVILQNSDNISHQAQSALLKILEEPPMSAIIIMEASNQYNFLPTILSRVVLIKTQTNEPEPENVKLANLNNLESIASIEKPIVWIDDQLNLLYSQLLKNIKNNKNFENLNLSQKIKELIDAKEMINANVNPKFTLFNLFFNKKIASE